MSGTYLNRKEPLTFVLWESSSNDFQKIHRKHICRSLSFNKVIHLQPKEKLLQRCFPVSFAKCFRTVFFQNTSGWLMMMMMMMMLMLMMMNCFCGMVDRRKVLSLISSRDHCQRSSPLRISDKPQNLFIISLFIPGIKSITIKYKYYTIFK